MQVALQLRRLVKQKGDVLVYYPPASPAWIPVFRDIIFFILARGKHRKWVFHFHAGGLPEFLAEARMGWLAKCFYPKPMVSISMSRDSELSPGQYFGGEDTYIPYGLDVPLQVMPRGHLAEKRLLFVGNLFLSKGVGLCLDAVSRLREMGHYVHLDIVGGTVEKDREAIREKVSALNLASVVTFHGVLSGDAKWERFAQADCFVFPTHYPAEKFPNVLIEALGAALPVVSTRWRGIPELLGENVAGSQLIEPRDLDALVAALDHILKSSDESYQSYQASSRKRYEECYTLDKFNRSILDAFLQACE
ncbi:glycosyltransferase family 4 protein [Coraliomargarita sp. W4R53]